MAGSPNKVAFKVAVRIQPLKAISESNNKISGIHVDSNQIQISNRRFTFDHVLKPNISQSELYETCVISLVRNLFEGYNSTVFSYGQTGSGKTYTMSGTSEEKGIIPRAVETIFQIIADNDVSIN